MNERVPAASSALITQSSNHAITQSRNRAIAQSRNRRAPVDDRADVRSLVSAHRAILEPPPHKVHLP
eukprot:3413934-Prymnesium_polylepis.1